MIQDLFATFDMARLPNAVNAPTLARLTRFVHDDLGFHNVEPTHYTVRELVSELCKFNTSGTLCWTLAGSTQSGGAPHGGPSSFHSGVRRDVTTDTAMSEMASAQRVFAHCAQPVVKQVESVLAQVQPVAPPVTPKPPVPLPTASGDEELSEWLKRLRFDNVTSALDGIASLHDLHFAVTEGDLTAADLEERGVPKFTVKRFIRQVEQVRLQGCLCWLLAVCQHQSCHVPTSPLYPVHCILHAAAESVTSGLPVNIAFWRCGHCVLPVCLLRLCLFFRLVRSCISHCY